MQPPDPISSRALGVQGLRGTQTDPGVVRGGASGRSSIQLPLAPLSRAETGLVAVAVCGPVPIRCRWHPHGSFQLIHNPHCRQCRVQIGGEGGGDAQARVLGLLHHPVVTPTACPPPNPPPRPGAHMFPVPQLPGLGGRRSPSTPVGSARSPVDTTSWVRGGRQPWWRCSVPRCGRSGEPHETTSRSKPGREGSCALSHANPNGPWTGPSPAFCHHCPVWLSLRTGPWEVSQVDSMGLSEPMDEDRDARCA